MTLEQLNHLDDNAFVAALGGIFEHSPWVARAVCEERPFASVAALGRAMIAAVQAGGEARQLALIRAHPDLAGKAAMAGDLTASSKQEQAGAGLDRLSAAEYARFHKLNEAYKAKFAFPFILAVKGHTKESILEAFEQRLKNTIEQEWQTALEQIYNIAGFRLSALLED